MSKQPKSPSGLRPWITNEQWDAAFMLMQAQAGNYPSARNPETRAAEIAYWRERVRAQPAGRRSKQGAAS
jgi:hypothetical protein